MTMGTKGGSSAHSMGSFVADKKASLLDESDSEQEDRAKAAEASELQVNKSYAKRFEINKKRSELQRLQEKYGDGEDNSESDSDDETEDEEGILVTDNLDTQISETLKAIRAKDPRIYDSKVVFIDQDYDAAPTTTKADKPIRLQDYHREKLLRGDAGADDEDDSPQTYVEEQAALKKQLLAEINASVPQESEDYDQDEVFIKRKDKRPRVTGPEDAVKPTITISEQDVANADHNPDLYLSNFLASKAWRPQDGSNWKPFDSDEEDDSELEDKAEEWEYMYNRRFEDPHQTNETLTTYSRDIAKQRSVRREKATARQRQRDQEKAAKAAEKAVRDEERARLRRLKIEEAEWRLDRIREVAGSSAVDLKDEDWVRFLDDEWDNDKWEEEMTKRFGDDYYARREESGSEGGTATKDGSKTRQKLKKPKWDDDVDINDIIPEFEDVIPSITLSDDEGDVDGLVEEDAESDDSRPAKRSKSSKEHKKDRISKKKEAKQQRSKIEALVDAKMDIDSPAILSRSSRKASRGDFRYRATSPNAFGMNARDILLAPSDTALNQFAGLKKLASFRDPDKKRKDRKRLATGHHLRMWRKEIFGPQYEKTGPTYGFEALVEEGDELVAQPSKDADGEDAAKRKRKRSKGSKHKKNRGDKSAAKAG